MNNIKFEEDNVRKNIYTGMYKPVVAVLVLNSLLMYCIIYIFWLAVDGMPNAYDSTDGFPVILDLILIVSIILNTAMSYIVISWILALRPDSFYDDWPSDIELKKVLIGDKV
tara:strand:+ start:920 stop:1255 length:336 start_codon:yes stop_codon:yes gene_type:complete